MKVIPKILNLSGPVKAFMVQDRWSWSSDPLHLTTTPVSTPNTANWPCLCTSLCSSDIVSSLSSLSLSLSLSPHPLIIIMHSKWGIIQWSGKEEKELIQVLVQVVHEDTIWPHSLAVGWDGLCVHRKRVEWEEKCEQTNTEFFTVELFPIEEWTSAFSLTRKDAFVRFLMLWPNTNQKQFGV